jgi:hypothetical protein
MDNPYFLPFVGAAALLGAGLLREHFRSKPVTHEDNKHPQNIWRTDVAAELRNRNKPIPIRSMENVGHGDEWIIEFPDRSKMKFHGRPADLKRNFAIITPNPKPQ